MEKILKSLSICFAWTWPGQLHALLVEVCIIRGSKDCGEVFAGCISLFYEAFYVLEDSGLLDPSDDRDILSLHYVYVPHIQHYLECFCDSYSHHKLSII